MRKFPILKTKQLDLVQIDHQYDQVYYEIMSKNEVTEFYGIESLSSVEEAAKIIDGFQDLYEDNRCIRWGIILVATQDFIGTVGLNNLNLREKKAEISFELHPSYWRKGITTEAVTEVLDYSFEVLDVNRMGAIVFPENVASNSLLKKLGFILEGKLRSYLYQHGESYDALVLSILKSEWETDDKPEIEERLQYNDHLTEIIKKAEQEGHFDGLPGKGKPLRLGQDYFNPAEKQVYRTMADNHILPRWVELGNEIDEMKEELSTLVGKERSKKVKEMNKKVKEFNLSCPPSLQRNKAYE